MKNVGTRLEDVRKRLSLSWGELATHIGISRAMLDFIRNGSREPSPKTARRIMEVERESGIVPLEDYDLPKSKLEKMEYGIPGDPDAIMSALKEITKLVRELKGEIEELRNSKAEKQ
jgi:transcriptional regulator with XRE-family HTH domain